MQGLRWAAVGVQGEVRSHRVSKAVLGSAAFTSGSLEAMDVF